MNLLKRIPLVLVSLMLLLPICTPAHGAIVYVKSVQSVPNISVSYGTARAAIPLPTSVNATLSNNTTKAVTVTWNNGSPTYNGTKAGTYSFTGTLKMPSGVTNLLLKTASAKVIVASATSITSVSALPTINVSNGTSLANIGLPVQVPVTLSNGTTTNLKVVWNSGTPAYSATTAGTYTFSGALTLTAGITNPQSRKATVAVIVAAPAATYIPNNDPNPYTSLNTSPGTALFEFDTTSEWLSSSSAKLTLNTANKLSGSGAIAWAPLAPISLVGTGHSYFSAMTAGSLGGALAAIDNTELGIYLPDTKNIAYMLVRFYTDDSYNYFFENAVGTWELSPGWNKLRRTKADYTYIDSIGSGTIGSWNNISNMEIFVVYSDTSTPSVTFDRFAINTTGKANVLFTFDDAWYDVLQHGYPILEQRGFKATTWAIAGDSSYTNDELEGETKVIMSENDLAQLYAAGWDIGNHTKNHPDNINLLSDAAVRTEYLDTQNWLLSKGWTRGANHVCYPSGSYNERLIEILKGIGVKTARTVEFGIQPTPVTNIYKLKTVAVGRDTDMELILHEVDEAIATGSSLFFMLHRVEVTPEPDDGGANYGQIAVSTDNLKRLVDYVYTYVQQNKLDVSTISQWYNAYMQ